MHRLKAEFSRWLHRFRHEEPAGDNQFTSPDCKRSDPIRPAKKLLRERSGPVSNEVSITNRDQHAEAVPRNLWKEAFEKLSPDTQDGLRKRGYEPSLNTDLGDLDNLLNDLRKKVELCDEERWVYKGKFVRDYAAKCATLVQGIGDLVVPFAPSQAAGPWGLIKVALKVPIEYDSTMFALLGTVDRVLHAIIRGRQYESAYGTENSDIVDTLRGDLVNVYWAVLKLLSYSIERLSEPTGARILATMLDNGSGHFSDLTAKEKELADTARACSAAQGEKATQHLQDIQGHLPRIETQVVECLAKLGQREAIDILEWVSTVKHKAHHDNVRNNRTPGTGDWLLRKVEFRDWEESSSSAVLWLRGSPGVGKTFLTSRVIDHIQDNLARTPNDEGFAYFYCNRNEDIRTRPLAVARSYVRQLSSPASKTKSSKTNSWHIQSTLQSIYKELRQKGADLDMECCTKLITESLNLYPRTTLVLDAFDECDPSSRGKLLELFEKLLSSSTRPVKLFIASRPDADVQQEVRSRPNIELRATDNQHDIQAYINQEMLTLIKKNSVFCDLQEKIKSTLSAKSQGMFQWTYLQLKQLERCISPEAILECLETLPETIDDTYEVLLEEIEKKPSHDRDLALRALKWVLAAREPLSRGDLLEAVRINPDSETLELCNPISDDALLALCRNFLVIDSERDVWRISHLSVAEYFELRRSWATAITDLMVGKACLLFMSDTCWDDTMFNPDARGSNSKPAKSYITRPFLYYVFCFWPEHIATLDPASVPENDLSFVMELLEKFLGAPQDSSARYRAWARCFDATLWPVEYSILTVCQYGLPVSDRWWNKGELDMTCTNDRGDTCMLLAARIGHTPIMRILLAKGGTLGLQGKLYPSTPLIEAVSGGHIGMVQFLLEEKEVGVNFKIGSDCALRAAIYREDSDMLRYLTCEAHADINIHFRYDVWRCALITAANRNWLEGVKILVEQGGADISLVQYPGAYGMTLRRIVPFIGSPAAEAVEYLVKAQQTNVNVSIRAGHYEHFSMAAAFADVQCVQYFLEVEGFDVSTPFLSSKNHNYYTALGVVALYVRKTVTVGRYGYVELREIVRILLAAGALVVLDVGDVEIVDALEVLHRGRQSRPRRGSRDDDSDSSSDINGDDEAEGGLFDDDDADDEHAKQVKAYARDTFGDLQGRCGSNMKVAHLV
ncbi:hypothetical protein ASPFODRAFT_202600 [Aspergillus luchuensis CBS 106.47]|uniref:Nephrocystin 3-like N-terminal domain-containing protein n=1 Tax=Aspergillus luchuensis (strain CBS 106.47) TaxID=1137211 RepID=A0A1M3U1F8_ASPLC|nr:hypothetical protein ASPFODRAFT_202600 [Aspergillus luchuensis CBS 106.47]